ncbi:MAG: prolyl oligopeptidase family serine peptidase, partial [Lachnospiraceae bacterium]|nr:prolyl oligopeptidase family serine peptidase [Lachnospiraceae bacterium]
YTEALKALIDEFIAKNESAIDTDRIYIGGDSNGGFMTVRMIMSYPKFFAAAYPICEAMIDEKVSEEDIANMKDQAIWFTHAKNDPVVVPDKYVLPTYNRLMAAGAKNVHFTFWDKIVDIHEGFKNDNGEPFEYLGHFAWIPMLNDDCKVDFDGKPVVVDGKEVTLLEWLAKQSLK